MIVNEHRISILSWFKQVIGVSGEAVVLVLVECLALALIPCVPVGSVGTARDLAGVPSHLVSLGFRQSLWL